MWSFLKNTKQNTKGNSSVNMVKSCRSLMGPSFSRSNITIITLNPNLANYNSKDSNKSQSQNIPENMLKNLSGLRLNITVNLRKTLKYHKGGIIFIEYFND